MTPDREAKILTTKSSQCQDHTARSPHTTALGSSPSLFQNFEQGSGLRMPGLSWQELQVGKFTSPVGGFFIKATEINAVNPVVMNWPLTPSLFLEGP